MPLHSFFRSESMPDFAVDVNVRAYLTQRHRRRGFLGCSSRRSRHRFPRRARRVLRHCGYCGHCGYCYASGRTVLHKPGHPSSRSAGRDERRSSGRRFTPPPRARCPCHAARHCGYCGCCYASGIHQAPAYACPSRKLITSYLLPITSYWSSANNRLGDTFRSHASSRRRMRARSRGVVSSAPVRWSQPCAR